MAEKIRHTGIVDSVDSEGVRVRILQTSACASCKVSGYCNASESKEKVIEVAGKGYAGNFATGDSVVVTVSRTVAGRALALGFGLPFAILVVVLAVVVLLTSDEVLGAVTAIVALVPYYFALYFLRDKIRGKMEFEVVRS